MTEPKFPLDFYSSTLGDTGEANKEAIAGIVNKEPLNQEYLNRGPYNLWNRTDVLKRAVDRESLASFRNFGFTVMSDPDTVVEFKDNGTGDYYFTIDKDLHLVPMTSLAGDSSSTGGTVRHARFVELQVPTVIEFQVEAHHTNLTNIEDGNNLYMRIDVGSGSTGAVASVEPAGAVPADLEDGPVTIVVTLDAAGNTYTEIVTAIKADVPSFVDATETKVVAGGSTVQSTPIARVRFSEADAGSSAAVGIEAHMISSATFVSFFNIGGSPNTMSEGEVLVADFSTIANRVANVNTATLLTGDLEIVNDNDGSANNLAARTTIPIAKVYDGKLCFCNGAIFEEDQAGRLVPDTSTRANLPFLIVGSDAGADYQTITAAFDALDVAGTGGTIYVKAGTYVEDIAITGVDGNVHLIGENGAVLQPSSSAVITGTGAWNCETVIIEGFTINAGVQQSFNVTNASATHMPVLRIRDCVINSAATSGINFIYAVDIGLHMRDNIINQTTLYSSYQPVAVYTARTGAGVPGYLDVEKCTFDGFAEVLEVASNTPYATIRFNNNDLLDAGYSTTTPGVLLTISEQASLVEVKGNRVAATVASANTANFIDVAAPTGSQRTIIAENTLLGTAVVPSVGCYVIDVATPGATFIGRTDVINNYIVCNYAGAITAAGAYISGNTFAECKMQGFTGHAVVYVDGTSEVVQSVVESNRLVLDSTALIDTEMLKFAPNADGGRVANNIIDLSACSTADHVGVMLESPRCVVSNNQILFNSASTGTTGIEFYTGADRCCVAANVITQVETGMDIMSGAIENVIAGNIIICDSTAATHSGILVKSANNHVSGNHCMDGTTGINITGSDNCVVSNSTSGCTTPIANTGSNNGMNDLHSATGHTTDLNYDVAY